jgi:hypothetical protein
LPRSTDNTRPAQLTNAYRSRPWCDRHKHLLGSLLLPPNVAASGADEPSRLHIRRQRLVHTLGVAAVATLDALHPSPPDLDSADVANSAEEKEEARQPSNVVVVYVCVCVSVYCACVCLSGDIVVAEANPAQ